MQMCKPADVSLSHLDPASAQLERFVPLGFYGFLPHA